jgi:hypothetical protein
MYTTLDPNLVVAVHHMISEIIYLWGITKYSGFKYLE